MKRPLATIAALYLATLYLVILVAGAAAAPVVAPDNPQVQDLRHVLATPSAAHWLGTDRLGRDVLSRLLFGARVSLLDVLIAATVFLLLGVPLGVLAGYRGGWLDRVAVRVADLLLAVPAIVVLLMVVAIFPGNDVATMTALGVIGCPGLLRVVRGSTLAIRGELYVEAARLSGLRTPAILRRHILPRIAGPIVVQTTLFCATALLAESGLSFLGLSRPETMGPSWGNMVAEAAQAMSQDAWLVVPAGGALMLTVMAFGLIGDAVRDATAGRSAQAPALTRRKPARRVRADAADDGPGDAQTTKLLEVTGLSVALPGPRGPVTVLHDVSLSIGAGEVLGIVGESGCGKSITGKAILGLLPAGGTVSTGSVRFNGTDLTAADEKSLSRVRGSGIALISQDPVGSLDPTFTVGSQLREIIRRHHKQSRRDARLEAERLLRLVNLPEPAQVLRLRAAELSGGMAQRVCIAMALAARPALLIADEPTTALDVTVQAEILALLRDLRHRLGMAVLLISHDWGVLADLCDHAVVMYAGQVIETAPIDELYAAPRHPYTQALIAANPANVAATAGADLPAIPGVVPQPGSWPAGCHFHPRCPIAQPDCVTDAIPLITPEPDRSARCVHIGQLERQ
jgi:oligopeptide/dipeptide ABC transporter ATP-binding protein